MTRILAAMIAMLLLAGCVTINAGGEPVFDDTVY